MKKFIFLSLIIFIIESVFAVELRLSPPKIEFNMLENQEICENVSVSSSNYRGILLTEDRWIEKGRNNKKIQEHNLSSDKLGLKVSYKKEIEIIPGKTEKIKLCISGKSGFYHGAFIVKSESNAVGIGNWISVNITKQEIHREFLGISKITSSEISIGKIKGKYLIFFILCSFVELLALLILVIKIKNKSKIV